MRRDPLETFAWVTLVFLWLVTLAMLTTTVYLLTGGAT